MNDRVGHDNGILFVGEGGKWIFVNRGIITASDPKLIKEPLGPDASRLVRFHTTTWAISSSACAPARRRFARRKWGIARRRSVTSASSLCGTGKKLGWDPVKQQFNDAEANKMLSRPMRAPWKLEV